MANMIADATKDGNQTALKRNTALTSVLESCTTKLTNAKTNKVDEKLSAQAIKLVKLEESQAAYMEDYEVQMPRIMQNCAVSGMTGRGTSTTC